jgi:AraC-like DNA-binding protein
MFSFNDKLLANRKLETLVENKTSYAIQHAELHVFETHQQAQQVLLTFSDPILASMIMGKKVMHLKDKPAFDFFPGESVILPQDELMIIDFPEASQDNPTKCLALRFDKEKLQQTIYQLNDSTPKENGLLWQLTDYNFHFTNNIAINQILQRLIFLFAENHPSKDFFANNMIEELLVRILQLEQQENYIELSQKNANSTKFSFIIDFIRSNIHQNFNIQLLSKKAHMSEANFYKCFKQELGITPNEFIIEEKLRIAESLLKNPNVSIKEAYLNSGFSSFSYFCRVFKKKHRINPGKFKSNQLSS